MLGDNIRKLRKLEKMTLEELADKVGVTAQYLSLLERNKRENPAREVIKKIADVFNVPASYLYEDDNPVPLDHFDEYLPQDIKKWMVAEKLRPYIVLLDEIDKNNIEEKDVDKLIDIIRILKDK